jgi:hypothetical protein
VKALRGALDETFDYLKQLTAGAEEDGHTQLTELHNGRSIVFIRASLQHSLTPSNVDNALGSLRDMQTDIKRCRKKVEEAFLYTIELYRLVNNQRPWTSINDSPHSSAMVTIRDKFTRLLKPQAFNRIVDDEGEREMTSRVATAIREPQKSPPPGVPLSSGLLQLPFELLNLIVTSLKDDLLEDIPRGAEADTLPALRL